MTDWASWHADYEDASSALAARLRVVQDHVSQALDKAPLGVVRVLSLCAGQGHDVIGVLANHRRRDDVRATLVEIEARNVELARGSATAADLNQIEIRQADAGNAASFADVLPADVLLLCGIFGNVSDADIERTIAAAPMLCSAGATVIWTRHRRAPDHTNHIRQVFQSRGFDELAFESPDHARMTGVGVNRVREPMPWQSFDGPIFVFTR